jgi:hypothetical protein
MLLVLLAACAQTSQDNSPRTALATVEQFYRSYLSLPNNKPRDAHPPFSKSWQELVDRNAAVCRKKAGSDICGAYAHGDMYLDSQEWSADLNFTNSGFRADEIKPGHIYVRFMLFPQYRDAKMKNARTLTFVMIEEDGRWVVDDIVMRNRSTKESIRQETQYFQSL